MCSYNYVLVSEVTYLVCLVTHYVFWAMKLIVFERSLDVKLDLLCVLGVKLLYMYVISVVTHCLIHECYSL